MYKYIDYTNIYGRVMQFNKNKQAPFHRWYPFVEGYSKEFIHSIINENNKNNLLCLEPFSGSGTTALELQNLNIECISFEVNPLMYLIAKVKLERNYTVDELDFWFYYIQTKRTKYNIESVSSEFTTLYENELQKKWNYNQQVGIALKKIKYAIESIADKKYRELFLIALSSILLSVSNLYRNGKCLSYKKKWQTKNITQEDVFAKYDEKILLEIRQDIEQATLLKKEKQSLIYNNNKLYNKDSRVGIKEKVENSSIDLVITSPPYLNSRDYTDTYMLELKTLDFTPTAYDIRELRKNTLRSHVQVKWRDETVLKNKFLNNTLEQLQNASKTSRLWNTSLVDMVRLYFVDMHIIFSELYFKMRKGGKVYFNVSNSAYFKVLVNTLEICASIAEEIGFKVVEIRKARNLKTSPQQQDVIKNLLEGVILLER